MKPIKLLIAAAIVSIGALTCSASIQAAELLMLEQNGCEWCEKWHEEIGIIYSKTDEGKIAPLRTVNIHQPWPDDLENVQIERFTPTFVLVENGVEIGRMRGYSGDEFFWFLLGEMLEKLPSPTDPV